MLAQHFELVCRSAVNNGKDRLPSAYFCYRELAKFGIVRGICMHSTLVWQKSATAQLSNVFLIAGCSKYKVLWW